MAPDLSKDANQTASRGPLSSVLWFWLGYVAITLGVGYATSVTVPHEIVQLTAWGFLSSLGLLALPSLLPDRSDAIRTPLSRAVYPASLRRLSVGFLVGAAAFALHLAIVATLAGPIRFERAASVGGGLTALFFARFLATSCMEEIGFRGYAQRRLLPHLGPWPTVTLTAVVFGLSHLLYGWDLATIALGVIPGGMVWGMSALATGGVAVPIGLHAAWNFAGWCAGSRSEQGLFDMILEESGADATQHVGTVSYLVLSGLLTLAFWQQVRRRQGSSVVEGSTRSPRDQRP